jgi:hypothetical protein
MIVNAHLTPTPHQPRTQDIDLMILQMDRERRLKREESKRNIITQLLMEETFHISKPKLRCVMDENERPVSPARGTFGSLKQRNLNSAFRKRPASPARGTFSSLKPRNLNTAFRICG